MSNCDSVQLAPDQGLGAQEGKEQVEMEPVPVLALAPVSVELPAARAAGLAELVDLVVPLVLAAQKAAKETKAAG